MDQVGWIRQRIKEEQARWAKLSRRIEALKQDLASELDRETQVTLQERLDDLEGRRSDVESHLRRLEMNLQSVFSDTDGDGEETLDAQRTLTQPVHLFLSYKHNVNPDQRLSEYLRDFLTAQGHTVFVDSDMLAGEAWLRRIDQQIKDSDFLIVLLSKESADSEMVQAEVRRACEYRKLHGRPRTLPVRIAYEGLLPYTIDAFVDPFQYVVWRSEADDERVGYDILAAIQGRLPQQDPVQAIPLDETATLSEDGRPIADHEALHPPLPEFDPRFLEELEAPGGAVKLRDQFYIERDADGRLKREVTRWGTTTTIRAPRQTGKTSLLVRGLHHARQNGAQIFNLNLQRVDSKHLQTLDGFLRYVADYIIYRLGLDATGVDELWSRPLSPQDKLTFFMEDHILSESVDVPTVLAFDEADRLLGTPLRNGFFGLLRSWHDGRSLNELWNRLNVIMVISTEPYLLIADSHQSPFNVGLRLAPEDFDEAQVSELNRRHGSPVQEGDFAQFMELLSGHPYLTRKALYVLVTERCAWAELSRVAAEDHGPFGDHLRRYLMLLQEDAGLKNALKQVIERGHCADDRAFFRLLRAGLIKGSGGACTCRCDLYRQYFGEKLR